MKKILFPIIALIFVATLGFIIYARLFANGGEDTWICQNGEWIKHGKPTAEMPKQVCVKGETSNVKK